MLILFIIIFSPAVSQSQVNNASSPSGLSLPTSLGEYIAQAAKKNGDLKSAVESYQASVERNRAIWGLNLPSLSATLSQTDTGASSAAFAAGIDSTRSRTISLGLSGALPKLGVTYEVALYGDQESTVIESGTATTTHTQTGSVSLSVALLKGFGPSVGSVAFDRSAITQNSSYWSARRTLITLIGSAVERYVAVFSAAQRLQATRTYLNQVIEFKKKYDALESAGQTSGLIVLNAQAQVQSIRLRLISLEDSLRSALYRYRELLDATAPGEKIPTDLALQVLSTSLFDFPPDWETSAYDPAQTQNPDIQIKKLSVESAQLDVTEARNNALPALNLTAGLSRISDPQTSLTGPLAANYSETSIALKFSMPIGLVREAAEQRATQRLLTGSGAELDQLRASLTRDWQLLVSAYRTARDQVKELQANVELAQKRARAALLLSDQSTSAQRDAIDFQNSANDALLDLIEAQSNLSLSKARLFLHRGELAPFAQLSGLRF